MPSTPHEVLQIGHPTLRAVSSPVEDLDDWVYRAHRDRLHATLAAFRAEHGFGRAISAPQIGVARRFIALNLGDGPFTMTNPEITWRSHETFTLWDDCMSFPFLLVKVRRHRTISVRYTNDAGERVALDELDMATSELLQHECDHLDGVLAVDRALDDRSLVARRVFEAMPEHFRDQVDDAIGAPEP